MNPKQAILKSIQNASQVADIADKLGEVALDSVLSDGLLKDIPVIGTALTLFKAGNDIAGYFFAKKIVVFLAEMESVSPEIRKNS